MNKKDLIIGVALISAVAVSGLIGLFFILNIPDPIDNNDGDGDPIEGLPTDWSTAPNSTCFLVNNHTSEFEVTLGDILEGVALALEEEQVSSGCINEYKNLIYYTQFYHQYDDVNYLVTGVDILDIFEKFHTHFAYNLSFKSKSSSEKTYITTEKLIKKMYEGPEDPLILLIAAGGNWLGDSPLGETYGNFAIVGKGWSEQILNLEKIEVITNWSIPVEVNGTVEYTLGPKEIKMNTYVDNYSYDRFDYWNFDRQYWGRNISDIISSYTSAKGENYTVKFYAADGVVAPYPPEEKLYDKDDVEKGINPPWKSPEDLINVTLYDPGVPLPETNLLMCLVYKHQEFGESYGRAQDPVWPYPKMVGYGRGPVYLLVPGRTRSDYIKYITKIEINITSN